MTLRWAVALWAQGTRYTHKHYAVESGKFVGHVPAEDFRAAEVVLLAALPQLLDDSERLRAMLDPSVSVEECKARFHAGQSGSSEAR